MCLSITRQKCGRDEFEIQTPVGERAACTKNNNHTSGPSPAATTTSYQAEEDQEQMPSVPEQYHSAADELAVPRLNQHGTALNLCTMNCTQNGATCQRCFSLNTYIRNASLVQGEA